MGRYQRRACLKAASEPIRGGWKETGHADRNARIPIDPRRIRRRRDTRRSKEKDPYICRLSCSGSLSSVPKRFPPDLLCCFQCRNSLSGVADISRLEICPLSPENKIIYEKRRFVFSEDFIKGYLDDGSYSEMRYSHVTRVVKSAKHYELKLSRIQSIFIPFRAFQSQEDMDAFDTLLRSKML
jgi:hypothetical protein